MATIGLTDLYYATITEDSTTGEETYGTPVKLAKAISAELSVEYAEGTLYADDALSESVKEFKSGTLTLGIDELSATAAIALLGVTADVNGILISAAEDISNCVAIGFRAKKADGNYRYFWLYRVKFSTPSTSLSTKGDSITFSTPSLEGVIMRRNKEDENENHPWKAEVTSSGTLSTAITNWFNAVYEPDFTT